MSKFRKRCPICKQGGLKKILDNYQYCPNCKTAWLTKIPHTKYSKSYYKPRFKYLNNLFLPVQNLLYLLRNLYLGTDKKKLWIDVGAGEGKYLEKVNAERKIGVEISESGREVISKKGFTTFTNNEFLRKRGLNAQIISFWQVLEHIPEPWKYLRAANINLSKNGKIIIGIPNIDSLDFLVFKRNWFHLAPKHHIWHFSSKSIYLLLKSEKFNITKLDFLAPEHHIPGIIQSFINMTSGSYNLFHGLLKRDTTNQKVHFKDVWWIFFWLTIGVPIVLFFWTINVLFKKSGAIVIIAKAKK